MGAKKELLEKDLDAAAHAVYGLPHAATADAAVRKDDMEAGDAAVTAAIGVAVAAEAAVRAAADLLIPGTITALTGDVGASGTGAVAATLLNLPQAVLLTRLAALSADPAFNSRKLTALADGVAGTDAATVRQLANTAFGVANKAALIAIDTTSLSTGVRRWVATYKAWFVLDKDTVGRSAIPHVVVAPTTGTGFWVREEANGDPYWHAVADWYFDPAGTFATAGDDEALGDSTHPIKSTAEWRRRVRGARYGASPPTIHVLSGSSVKDDGMFYGFTCESQLGFVKLMATPTVIGSGTVTGYAPYSGNTRGSLTDSGMAAASWTAAGWVTTSSGSRFIRKAGSGARAYAPVLLDLGAKTVQLGVANALDETAFPLQPSITEVNFAIGDAYEIVSMPAWPAIQTSALINVGVKCLDIGGAVITTMVGIARFQLCGFVGAASILQPAHGGGFLAYNCVYCVTSPAVVQFTGWLWFVANCSFLNITLGISFGGPDLNVNAETNVFINCTVNFQMGSRVSLGNMRFYDCSAPLIHAQYGAGLNLTHPVVGSGNTGPLVSCHDGSRVTGAAQITAATSFGLPYVVAGVGYTTPIADGSTGDGVYN